MSVPPRSDLLSAIYGPARSTFLEGRIDQLLSEHGTLDEGHAGGWSERDVWLITYPDQFQRPGEPPLRTLRSFYDRHFARHLTGIHVLPFFPWSSDDGFAVIDYEEVDPRYGTWDDIERLAGESRLMVDAVINHLSSESPWFQGFLRGDPAYAGFFRTEHPSTDVSRVVRPRTHPLLTPYHTATGETHVWTTFSEDQVDLDFSNPDVLLRVLAVLLDYARRGADAIRLDAVGFLWKDPATPSIHLPETHAIIQLIRSCLDDTYPHVLLLTETNVPHSENVTYFGGDHREAQSIYQFTLPPLVMHAVLTGDASHLGEWAATASADSGPGRTFFNFLSSHDGIGLRPVEDRLPPSEIDRLVEACESVGGRINWRLVDETRRAPYEMNTTWLSAMRWQADMDTAVRRHLASHALMLSMPGMAGIYVHSLLGGLNDQQGLERTGHNRSLHRRKFTGVPALEASLADQTTVEHRVLNGVRRLIELRRSTTAFHPDAAMRVLELPETLFGIERTAASGAVARCIVNLGSKPASVATGGLVRLGSGARWSGEIGPLESVWLEGR